MKNTPSGEKIDESQKSMGVPSGDWLGEDDLRVATDGVYYAAQQLQTKGFLWWKRKEWVTISACSLFRNDVQCVINTIRRRRGGWKPA
jgi:hypothetical protein